MYDDIKKLIAEGLDDESIVDVLADDATDDERAELLDLIYSLRSQVKN